MDTARHTLKLHVGRAGPITCSDGPLPPGDERCVRDAAALLVGRGGDGAALGLEMPSGRTIILRRMRSTVEVRGIIDPPVLAPAATRALLSRDPLWASPSFAEARPLPIDAPGSASRHVAPWCAGFADTPAGFTPLAAREGPQAATRAGAPAVAPPRPVAPAVAAGTGDAVPDVDWPLLGCAAVTILAIGFLAVGAIAGGGR